MKKSKAIVKQVPIEERLAMVVTKQAGHAAVESAITRTRQEATDRIIEFTKATINRILQLKQAIVDHERWLEFQKKRLAAIEAGKFSQPFGTIIKFDDEELNQ